MITRQEQHENGAKEQELLEKAALEFQPDAAMGVYNNPGLQHGHRRRPMTWSSSPAMASPANGSFQFVEGEYMKPEDYDAFIEDPADWSIRKYWPRVFPELAGFGMLLPPLGMAAFGHYNLYNLGVIKAPPVAARPANVDERGRGAGQVRCAHDGDDAAPGGRRFCAAAVGRLALIEAPFDFMSDTLRGMRGIMLDIHRRPAKLLAAMEKVLKFQLEFAISWSRATGLNVCLHPAAPRLGRLHVAAAVREVLLADPQGDDADVGG